MIWLVGNLCVNFGNRLNLVCRRSGPQTWTKEDNMSGAELFSVRRRLMSCCVPNCAANTDDPDISYHSFPKEADLRVKWQEILGLSNPDEMAKVCSVHFHADDFFPTFGEFKKHKLKVKRLKRTAVPSQMLPSLTGRHSESSLHPEDAFVKPEPESDQFSLGTYCCTTCGFLAKTESSFLEHLSSHVKEEPSHENVEEVFDPFQSQLVKLEEEVLEVEKSRDSLSNCLRQELNFDPIPELTEESVDESSREICKIGETIVIEPNEEPDDRSTVVKEEPSDDYEWSTAVKIFPNVGGEIEEQQEEWDVEDFLWVDDRSPDQPRNSEKGPARTRTPLLKACKYCRIFTPRLGVHLINEHSSELDVRAMKAEHRVNVKRRLYRNIAAEGEAAVGGSKFARLMRLANSVDNAPKIDDRVPVSDGVDHSRFTTEADDPERLEWRRSANEAVLPAHRRHKLTNFAPYDEDRLKFGDQSLRFSLNSMGVRIHKCAFCSFLTRDVCLAHAHFQLHASKKRFGCFSCQRFFDSHESLMIGHSGSVCRKILVLDFFLQCDECWRFFSVESEFINHKVLNQCVNVTKVVCKVCGFTCTKSKINAHMKEHKVDDDFVSNET